MISAIGPQHGRRGRSPIAYVVRDSAGFVVGLDLGGTNIRAGAADVFGEMIHDDLEPTTKAGGRALAAQLADVVTRAVERGRATHDRLLAIAISTPGRGRPQDRARPPGLQRVARRRPGPAGRGGLALRGPRPHRQQHQPRRAGREVLRAGPRRLDDGVHRHRCRRRDGDHHARRARARRPWSGGRDRLPAARRRPLRPPAQAARRPGGRDRGGGRARRLRRPGPRAHGRGRDRPGRVRARPPGDRDAGAVVEHIAARLGSAIATVCAILDPELVVLGGGIGSSPLLLQPGARRRGRARPAHGARSRPACSATRPPCGARSPLPCMPRAANSSPRAAAPGARSSSASRGRSARHGGDLHGRDRDPGCEQALPRRDRWRCATSACRSPMASSPSSSARRGAARRRCCG